jgi:hypothetical protein
MMQSINKIQRNTNSEESFINFSLILDIMSSNSKNLRSMHSHQSRSGRSFRSSDALSRIDARRRSKQKQKNRESEAKNAHQSVERAEDSDDVNSNSIQTNESGTDENSDSFADPTIKEPDHSNEESSETLNADDDTDDATEKPVRKPVTIASAERNQGYSSDQKKRPPEDPDKQRKQKKKPKISMEARKHIGHDVRDNQNQFSKLLIDRVAALETSVGQLQQQVRQIQCSRSFLSKTVPKFRLTDTQKCHIGSIIRDVMFKSIKYMDSNCLEAQGNKIFEQCIAKAKIPRSEDDSVLYKAIIANAKRFLSVHRCHVKSYVRQQAAGMNAL